MVGEVDACVKNAFAEIARKKEYDILEFETNEDHVHMLLKVKEGDTLSAMMRVIKSVSAKKVLARIPHLPSKLPEDRRVGNGNFWAPRYKWRKVPAKQLDVVRDYIRNQKKY